MAERACILYKETRIGTDVPITSSTTGPNVINVRLPSHRVSATHPPRRRSVQLRSSSPSSQRGSTTEKQRDIEAIFAYSNLARAASIFFRRDGTSPRSILHRVLEDWEVLSIQAVDVVDDVDEPTSGLHASAPVLRFHFPDKIRENCVAFADVPNKDDLKVYVMTVVNTLYTLTLKGGTLRDGGGAGATRAGRGGGIGLGNLQESEYCKTYYPSTFSLHSPHFLVAVDYERILVSLQDGTLLKLERGPEDDVDATESVYHEKTFSDTSVLGLLRNKLPWVSSGTSRYKDTNVSHSTVISTEFFHPQTIYDPEQDGMPPGYISQEVNHTLLFTVSVNHTLKVWSYERQQLLHASDLVNQPPTDSNIKTLLHPTPARLLAVISSTLHRSHLFYLVTFSPVSTGTFKFWIGHGDTTGRFTHLEDIFKDHTFDAMPPTASSVWIISDFRVTPVSEAVLGTHNLWILWKSNTSFKIQNLQFNMETLPETWSQWVTSTTDSLHSVPGKSPLTPSYGDATERWMEWIFYPERFPASVIEAALGIYEQHFSRAQNIRTSKSMTLQARVGKIVASAVEIQRGKDGNVNLDKYRHDVGLQWDRFVRLCVELDRQRGEALSLVADSKMNYIWTVNADGLTALRECTETEMMVHNQTASKEIYQLLTDRTPSFFGAGMSVNELAEAILLIRAGGDLMGSLQLEEVEQCIIALQEETLQDPMISLNDRMWSLLERCITGRVPRHALSKIDNAIAMVVSPEHTIQGILSSIFCPKRESGLSTLTEFGTRVLLKGTQEIVNINNTILLNLAFLVIIATFPSDAQETGISNGEELFFQIMNYFKEYEILKWITRKSIPIQEHATAEDILTATLSGLRVSDILDTETIVKSGSVLQLVFSDNIPTADLSYSLTIRNLISTLNLSNEQGVLNVASALIRTEAVLLAMEFHKFLPNTYWGCYLKGRIYMKNCDYAKAAILFKKSAAGLGFPIDQHPNTTLRDVIGESELQAFGSGMPQYYMHIAKLYEDCESWGLVADFCRAALYSLWKKSEDDEFRTLKMGILSKMFQALLKISKFDEAYLIMMQFTNKSLQLSALGDLVEAMVEQDQGLHLVSYPFAGLQDEVDETLSAKCETIVDVATGPPFHKVLYAWRIQHGDYRGAASVLHQRLQRLKTANIGSSDPQAKSVTDGFLALLNVLSCVDEDQAWILSSNRTDADNVGTGSAGQGGGTNAKRARTLKGGLSSGPQKRQVLTLKDITEEYQREVDRQGLLLHGGFFV